MRHLTIRPFQNLANDAFYSLEVPWFSEPLGREQILSLPVELKSFEELDDFMQFYIDESANCQVKPAAKSFCRDHPFNILQSATIDIHSGIRWPLLPVRGMSSFIGVEADLAERVRRRTPLTGFKTVVPRIQLVNQEEVDPHDADLELMMPSGEILLWQRQIADGEPNACQQCEHGPIFCETCWYMLHHVCPKCKARCELHSSNDEKKRQAMIVLGNEAKVILWGRSWDGSDFCGQMGHSGFIVTKRALDWLLSIHAAPFIATPHAVCTDDMSPEQLTKLKQAQEMFVEGQ